MILPTLLALAAIAADAPPKLDPPVITEVLRREIPNVPGRVAHAYRVRYRPLQASSPHTHHGFLVIYMLRGTIESRVGDGPTLTFRPGDSWTENPGDLHRVCRNPSSGEPAEFLVVSVDDTGAGRRVDDKGGAVDR